jgi:predicted DNA-binding transcriptional regulator YafY
MDRYERITALHRLLKSARYPVTVATLQDKLGCSRATVYRDLAFLRDALMAPIEGDGEAGFRYQADESDRFELPGLWLSSEELHALLASQHLLARTGGCCRRCWHRCSSASRACWRPRPGVQLAGGPRAGDSAPWLQVR